MEKIKVKEALKWGWGEFKANPWFYVYVVAIIFAVSIFVSWVSEDIEGFLGFLLGLGGTLLQWWLSAGVILVMLGVYKKRKPEIKEIFSARGKLFWNYVLGTILYGIIVMFGFLLLIVPGIVWSVKYKYYDFLIIDKGLGPIEALKASGELTKGFKWQLLGFFIVIGLLNLLGALALFVGLFVTIPVSFLAYTYVYKFLDEKGLNLQISFDPKPVAGSADNNSE